MVAILRICIFFCEGFFEAAVPPFLLSCSSQLWPFRSLEVPCKVLVDHLRSLGAPRLLALGFYYVSQGCSAVYLLFAVWLSMHASVSSHSYSTRLLTRFVRLPIPGSEQINVLNARYADFEKQGRQRLAGRDVNSMMKRCLQDMCDESFNHII